MTSSSRDPRAGSLAPSGWPPLPSRWRDRPRPCRRCLPTGPCLTSGPSARCGFDLTPSRDCFVERCVPSRCLELPVPQLPTASAARRSISAPSLFHSRACAIRGQTSRRRRSGVRRCRDADLSSFIPVTPRHRVPHRRATHSAASPTRSKPRPTVRAVAATIRHPRDQVHARGSRAASDWSCARSHLDGRTASFLHERSSDRAIYVRARTRRATRRNPILREQRPWRAVWPTAHAACAAHCSRRRRLPQRRGAPRQSCRER